LHHAIITLPKLKKRFNPLAGSEPTAYAATGTGTRYLRDEKYLCCGHCDLLAASSIMQAFVFMPQRCAPAAP
jgi:hypothetical protein